MRSLFQFLQAVPDFRRRQGRRHSIASVAALLLLAQLCGKRGCLEAERVGRSLGQEELKAIGAWRNPRTGVRHPPGKSTIHRVLQQLDADALEDVLAAWCRERQRPEQALAGDGKRINGANRHGRDQCETVTLIEHESHLPIAVRGFRDQGGELAAMADLFERTDIAGRTVTLDALHTPDLTRTSSGTAPTICSRSRGTAPKPRALQAVDGRPTGPTGTPTRFGWTAGSRRWRRSKGRSSTASGRSQVTRCREEAPPMPPRKKHRELAAEARCVQSRRSVGFQAPEKLQKRRPRPSISSPRWRRRRRRPSGCSGCAAATGRWRT